MHSCPSAVRVRVPAKINLALAVGELRADGFHELCTVFHAIDLYDTVTATDSETLSITCDDPNVPVDATNLAWRAATALAELTGTRPRVALKIEKSIPVAGGMAGGSADGAAALVACNSLWRTGIDLAGLTELATGLGSDVPFALLGRTAVGRGRGELLEPIACPPLHWVVVPTTFGISAGQAYRALDGLRAAGWSERADASTVTDALRRGDLAHLAGAMCNDLQVAAMKLRTDELQPAAVAIGEAGALKVLVSGSGPTLVGLCRTSAHAVEVANTLVSQGIGALTASGPAPGATVID